MGWHHTEPAYPADELTWAFVIKHILLALLFWLPLLGLLWRLGG